MNATYRSNGIFSEAWVPLNQEGTRKERSNCLRLNGKVQEVIWAKLKSHNPNHGETNKKGYLNYSRQCINGKLGGLKEQIAEDMKHNKKFFKYIIKESVDQVDYLG